MELQKSAPQSTTAKAPRFILSQSAATDKNILATIASSQSSFPGRKQT